MGAADPTIPGLMRRIASNIGAKLPQGWPDVFGQLVIFICADLLYETARGFADGKREIAFANGQTIIDFERATGTFFEPGFQAMFLPAQWVIDIANQIYMNSQFAIFIGFLVWLYLRRNETFYFVRNMVIVSMVFAAIGYTLYPTAPPRMFAEYGFIDTINDYSSVNHDSALVKVFINPYAAVPSMHCAFALMIGLTGVQVARHRASRLFWAMWPVLVIWVVIVTANHYWVDAALGAAVAAASALVASRLLARARPESWSFRREPLGTA